MPQPLSQRPLLDSAAIDDRTLLYAQADDQVLLLQPLASRAWGLLDAGRSLDEVRVLLGDSAGPSDASAVLAELVEAGALVDGERPAPALRAHRGRFVEVKGAAAALAALNIAATALGLSDAHAAAAPSSGGYAAPAA